jgi:adenylate cyclase
LKKIEAIVRAELMSRVKERLKDIGVSGTTITTVSGWSKQRELHLQWRGMPVSYDLIPMAKFEIVAPDSQLDDIIQAIIDTARTGEPGDGIILISTIEQAINIYYSELVEHLNEALSTENALVDRITSRIDRTSIQEVKQRLKQHLEETHIQKNRLKRIITGLEGKPTYAKADLSRSNLPTTMPMRRNFPKTTESKTEGNSRENSTLEEDELVQMKQDFIIEHDELVTYESLIRTMQMTDMPQQHEIILLLEQSMREEESMAYWYKIHTPLILNNLWPKIIHTSIKRGQNFLLNHISSKIPLIIIYADLVGSTTMSMTMPVDKLVTIIRAFTYELSHVVDSYGGYVLKYVGDAVISFFPFSINNNSDNKYLTCGRSVECAKSMINVVKDEINAILNKRYGYPELSVKIGIDAGENAIVQYGYEQHSPIDILGYTMNVAAKITSLTAANKVSIGDNVCKSLDHKIQSEFHELEMPGNEWKYINYETDIPYKVYTLNG